MVKRIAFIAIISLMITSCFKDSPSIQDGDLTLKIYVKYEGENLSNLPVTLITDEYAIGDITSLTDDSGLVIFESLPFAMYQVSVQGETIIPSFLTPGELDTIVVTGNSFIEPGNDNVYLDTIFTIASGTAPGIKINEIYSCGPPNNFFYFYDQYYELYNSSEDTLYLDGMLFCRMGAFLANVTSVFQFPGEPMGGTEDYPINPGEFIVVASDAYNHKDLIFNGSASVDLSVADFEFKNAIELNDPDDPNVPNLENIETGYRKDFLVGLTGDVVLLSDGSDLNYLDGIDMESVIDCVEWSANPEHNKEIEDALDRGFGGVGQAKYSGTSMERVAPGFDTNNSTIDFVLIPSPTIGYHHE